MGNDVMVSDFPDARQRYAVCASQLGKGSTTAKKQRVDRRRYLAVRLRTQLGIERNFRRRYAATLDRYVRAAATAYKEQGERGVGIAFEGQREEMRKLLTANYLTAGERFRSLTLEDLTGEVEARKDAESQFERSMLDYVQENAVTRSALIADTTETLVREAIVEGVKEGDTPTTIAKRIVNTAGGAVSRLRADAIAITETHNAATFASDVTAEDTGLRLEKEWLATEDSRTRPTHSEADGQRVGMNETFTVGGYQMKRPGDPDAPAKETIRCRCTVLYHEV